MKTYEAFLETVRQAAQEQMPNCTFEMRHVEKPTGEQYLGLSVRPEHAEAEACYPMRGAYEAMVRGDITEADLVREIVAQMQETVSAFPVIPQDAFLSYEKARALLTLEMLPLRGNEKLLEQVLHRKLGDIAVTYRVSLSSTDDREFSMRVTHRALEEYGVSQEQLHRDAVLAELTRNPPILENLADTLGSMTNGTLRPDQSPLWLATVSSRVNGSIVTQYPTFLDACANQLEGSFYIIPSSIHEVLLISDREASDVRGMEAMVRDVNESMLDPADFLSDTVFHYDSRTRMLETAADYEKRVTPPDRQPPAAPVPGRPSHKTVKGGDAR